MSFQRDSVRQNRDERGGAVRPEVEAERDVRVDGHPGGTRRTRQPGLAGLPATLRHMGNAAMVRLLGKESRGRALDPSTSTALGNSLGADLSGARIHDDTAAHAVADALNARAVTSGDDVYLAADAPAPETQAGKELLAHEMAHVVQQRQAAEVDLNRVSQPGDQSERAAETAARQAAGGKPARVAAGGTSAGVQRQFRGQGASRAEVEAALTAFLQRALQAQGGQRLRLTPEVRNAVEMLAGAPDPSYHGPGGDPGRALRLASLQSWMSGGILPGVPAEFAQYVARHLPDPFDRATLDRLRAMAGQAPTTAVGRVTELVEHSGAAEAPPRQAGEGQAPEERAEQLAQTDRRLRGQPEPSGFSPISVDVLRAARILRGLPGAIRGPQTQPQVPEARSYPEVERAIQGIASNALVPAEARGRNDDSYADAREVARDLARRLDIAQQQNASSVDLHLGANYATMRDRAAIDSALTSIVNAVRDALPHHASSVRQVNVYFGDHLVRWIPVSGATQ